MALRQQLLQQQAQQQRGLAAAGGGLPFTGAQIGTARLPPGGFGGRLGGGLDGSSLPLSQLLNAQNLPLRKGGQRHLLHGRLQAQAPSS